MKCNNIIRVWVDLGAWPKYYIDAFIMYYVA